MLNTKLKGFSLTIWALLMLLTINSCSDNNEDEKEEKGKLVITEIMAANHAGLLAKDGELYDWIEIKNISSEAVSVKDYSLAFEKSDKKKGKSKKKDGKGKKKDGQKKKRPPTRKRRIKILHLSRPGRFPTWKSSRVSASSCSLQRSPSMTTRRLHKANCTLASSCRLLEENCNC